jgi:hypothetical protein
MCVEKALVVKLWQTDWKPGLGSFEGVGRADKVHDNQDICNPDTTSCIPRATGQRVAEILARHLQRTSISTNA